MVVRVSDPVIRAEIPMVPIYGDGSLPNAAAELQIGIESNGKLIHRGASTPMTGDIL